MRGFVAVLLIGCTAGPTDLSPIQIRHDAWRAGAPPRVMPLGDSTTARTDAYRAPLWRALDGRVDFVGSQSNGGESIPDNQHEGHPGWTLGQLSTSVASFLGDNPADVVLAHAGINDIIHGEDASEALAHLGAELDVGFEASPDTVWIVAQVAPFRFGDLYDNPSRRAELVAFNAGVPDVVSARVARGMVATVVDCNTGYDAWSWFDDEVHPDATGNEFIAGRFLSGLQSF